MIKILKLTIDNQTKEVAINTEEMLTRFEDMINQFAHQCVKKTSGYQGCTDEFEDYKQIATIKAIEKFEDYDITKGANFSTILFTALRGLVVDIIRKNESQMVVNMFKKNFKANFVFKDAKDKFLSEKY